MYEDLFKKPKTTITKTIRAIDIKVDTKKKVYSYGDKTIKFFFDDEPLLNVNDFFLGHDISFEFEENTINCLELKNPFSCDESNRKIKFLWLLNFEINSWVKNCTIRYMKFIASECVDSPIDISKRLLRGFSYAGKFGNEICTRLMGNQIYRLCCILYKRSSLNVRKAADLLNSRYNGHISDSDTAIPECIYNKHRVPYDILLELGLLVKSKSIINNQIFLRLPVIKEAEERLYESFQILTDRFDSYGQSDEYYRNVLPETLCDEQVKSVNISMGHGVSYITGSAGRGKSSSIMEIIRRSSSTIILTPTHAARKVVQSRVDKSSLGKYCRIDVIAYVKYHVRKYKQGKRVSGTKIVKRERDLFGYTEGEPLLETLIIEEASMVDIVSASKSISGMVNSFPSLKRVVFVGDTKQLRSISKGNMLDDIIKSNSIPGTSLTINHRSGSLSTNIDCILNGDADGIKIDPGKFDVVYVDEVDIDNGVYHLAEKVHFEMSNIVRLGENQVHSLCYMHKELDKVNNIFKETNGKIGELRPGLKLRVTRPSGIRGTTVYGNDLLEVVSHHIDEKETIIVVKEWNRTKRVESNTTFEIIVTTSMVSSVFVLGFSTTCHSFQGDEADAIVVHAVQNCKYFDRLALYTAVSRAREKVVIVTVRGERSWLEIIETLNPDRISCFSNVLDGEIVGSD